MVQHHIEACAAIPDIREILLLGYFPAQQLQQFVADMIAAYKIRIRYCNYPLHIANINTPPLCVSLLSCHKLHT